MPQYPDTSKTLIEKVRAGDEVSWCEFYDKYEPIIQSIGSAAGLNESDCDDLTQNVMLQFFRYSKTFRFSPGISRFRTYFHSIVRTRIANLQQGKEKNAESSEVAPIVEPPPDEKLDTLFMEKWKDFVWAEALKRLSGQVESKTYLSFTMTALQGRSVSEVAEFLQLSNDNIYVNRNRCIAALKKIVAEYNCEDPLLKLPEAFNV